MAAEDFVRVLRTSDRFRMEAACSLLRHEGIPFHLRESRELLAYLPQDDLQLYVPAARSDEAGALMALLDQPAYPVATPYRGAPDPFADPEIEATAAAAPEHGEAGEGEEADGPAPPRRSPERVRSAIILTAVCAFALVVVVIGLAIAYRESFARHTSRVTPLSTRYGAYRGP